MPKVGSGRKRPQRPPREDFHAALAGRLRQVTRGCTLREVAELTGSNHESVRRYLAGQSPPPAEFLAAISRATGVSADWLLHGRGTFTAEHIIDRLPLRFLLSKLAKRLEELRW